MQLEFPFLRTSAEPSVLAPAPPRLEPLPIQIVRVRRARRYIVRVRHDGAVRVTVPRGGSRAEALRFLETHRAWVEQERLRVGEARSPGRWGDGATILLHGEPARLSVAVSGDCRIVRYGDRTITAPDSGDLAPSIEADLRALARDEIVPRLHELASLHGLNVTRVMVRGQRSRWASCSNGGTIALNFRTAQMPPAVRDYILLHELMHLKEQSHSRRFWRLVEQACPGYREAERWLKTDGRALF